MINIRKVCIAFNEEFAKLGTKKGLALEMINVGSAPGDGKGDSIEDALIKFIRNLRKILE